jgi:hypothetical protein
MDPRTKPIIDWKNKRIIYKAIVSRDGETRVITGAVRDWSTGRVINATPPLQQCWDEGERIEHWG